jgi:LemA protein
MWVALAVIAAVLVLGVVAYNSLIQRKNRVDNAWSQIDVQLKRRLDLIPNLVETVKGYAAHEQSTFDAVIKARQSALAAPSTPSAQAGADNAVAGALRQLFALSEAYPDLKANQNFLALQEELTATEGRVAYARQFYNDEVLGLNAAIEKVPGVFIARLAGITAREYFSTGPEAQEPPKVSF